MRTTALVLMRRDAQADDAVREHAARPGSDRRRERRPQRDERPGQDGEDEHRHDTLSGLADADLGGLRGHLRRQERIEASVGRGRAVMRARLGHGGVVLGDVHIATRGDAATAVGLVPGESVSPVTYDDTVTHEYVIAMGGLILDAAPDDGGHSAAPTAIAWAADRVLALGSDDVVRAISRGDSTFLDLGGCVVSALDPGAVLEPGAPADLAFWAAEPAAATARPVAVVRRGVFTEGDEHCGPFPRLPGTLADDAET